MRAAEAKDRQDQAAADSVKWVAKFRGMDLTCGSLAEQLNDSDKNELIEIFSKLNDIPDGVLSVERFGNAPVYEAIIAQVVDSGRDHRKSEK
jgi:hypothetical protein